MKPIIFVMLAMCAASASAITVGELPFVQALKNGRAVGPLPAEAPFAQAAAAMQARTGNSGPITVMSYRISRFIQQPNCGRIGFGLYQEATNTLWAEAGGQMNICANGFPPNRICASTPGQLVPFDGKCSDGSHTIDTPEIRKAIEDAERNGGVSLREGTRRAKEIENAAQDKARGREK